MSKFTWEASKHEGSITILMLITVDISSMLQQQSAHVCFALIGHMHERGHAILKRHEGKDFINVLANLFTCMTQKQMMFRLVQPFHKLWKSRKCVFSMVILSKHWHLLRVTWAGWVIIFAAPWMKLKDCVGGTVNKQHIWFWQVGHTYNLLFWTILAPKRPQDVCRLHLVACIHYHTSLSTFLSPLSNISATQESLPYAWITMRNICHHLTSRSATALIYIRADHHKTATNYHYLQCKDCV